MTDLSPFAVPQIFGVLDVGTNHIVCMIAVTDDQAPSGLSLLGLGHQVARGVKASVVVDLEAAQEAVWAAIYQAQRMAGVSLERVYVASGAGRVMQRIVTSSVTTVGGVVAARDMARLETAARAFAAREDSVALYAERLQLYFDGRAVAAVAVGARGQTLKADFSIVAGDAAAARNMAHVVESQSLPIAQQIPSPVATAYAVTTSDERLQGVTVIDCGAGTTTLVMFAYGHVIGISTIPVGGNHLTFDIARQLQAPLNEAERIKLECGISEIAQSVAATAFDASGPDLSFAMSTPAPRALIRQILTSRASALVRSIAERLERFQATGAVQATAGRQVVLAGGASRLRGFDGLARELLGRPVQLGRVRVLQDFPAAVHDQPFAAALGVLALLPRPAVRAARAGMEPFAGASSEKMQSLSSTVGRQP